MAKVCDNTKVRLPTVNIVLTSPPTPLPDIIPSKTSSALLTSDGYMIDTSAYLLTFIIDSSIGYFEDFSATFSSATGFDSSLVFKPCNIITNLPDSGCNNYMMYLVLNCCTANQQGKGKTEKFSYKVTYVIYDESAPVGSATPSCKGGVHYLTNNSGSIDNGGW